MNKKSNKKRRINGTEKPHECPYCNKTFEMLESMKRHLRLHETSPCHQCEICDKKFHERSTLNRHVSVTHLGMKKYECTICGGKFASKANLDKHMRTLHPTAPEIQMKLIKCSDCDSYFQNKIHHSNHVRLYHRSTAVQEVVHNEPEKKPKNTDESRNTHEANCDNNDILAKALDKSEVELISEPDIRTTVIVMKNHRRHYKCDVCGQLKNKMSSLKRHMGLHYTTKPFQCPSCDGRFKRLTELRRHIKRIHNLKCKSNNNGVLWRTLNDLNNHIWAENIKENKMEHIVKKRNQKIENIVDNDKVIIVENHIVENLLENENVPKLSMPILDEESIPASLPVPKQSNETKKFNPATTIMIPVSEIYETDKNTNHLEEINFHGCSNQNNVIFAEPITSTGFLKDALLGQANVPLIKEIDVNSRTMEEKYPHALTKGAFNDQFSFDDVNTGFTYPLGDTDSCPESGFLDKNLLQIIGLNDIMVNEEPNESLQSNQEVHRQKLTPPNKFQDNFSNTPINSIIKLKKDEANERAIIISDQINDASSKTLCSMDSIMVTPETSYENNFGENRISEMSNNINISDFNHFNETKSDSRLLGMSANNTNVSLIECSIDVSFDLNELSSEFDNPNISLTDIVEGMCSQNYLQRNASIESENCIIHNLSNDESIVKGKAIISGTSTSDSPENETETEIVNVETFVLGTMNQKESYNTCIDNINYGSDMSTKTNTGAHKNMNTCTLPFHIQETNQLQATKLLEIEKHDHQKSNVYSQVMGIVTLPTYANSIIDTVENPEIPNDMNTCTVPIHIQEPNRVQATNSVEIKKCFHNNSNESPQIMSMAVMLPTCANSILDTVKEPETPKSMNMCTAPSYMQEPNLVQTTSPMEIENYVTQNMNESSQIKSKLVLSASVFPVIDAVEEPESSTNHNIIEEQIEFRNACLTHFDLEDPLGIFSTNDIIHNDDNALLSYHEETNINKTGICTSVKEIPNSQLYEINPQKDTKNLPLNNFVPNEYPNEGLFMMDQYELQNTNNLMDNANGHHQNKPSNNFTQNPLESPSESGCIQNVIDNLATKVNLFEKDYSMQYDLSQSFVMPECDRQFTVDPKLLHKPVPNQDTLTHAAPLENIDTTSEPIIERLVTTIILTNSNGRPLSPSEIESSTLVKIMEKMKMNSFEHKCDECPASFQRAPDLRRHGDVHRPRLKYVCDRCGKVVRSKIALMQHMKYHNSKKTLCWVCGRMICEISFDRHKCFSTYVYACPLCDKSFTWWHSKKQHILENHIYKNNGQHKRKNKIKNKKNSPEGAEDNLVGLIEQLDDDPCEILNPIKKKIGSVTTKPKTHKCELCENEFKRKDNLRKHMEKKHNENIQEFKCECGAIFLEKLQLLQHRKINGNKPHTSPFACKFCSIAFSKRSLLQVHLKKLKCHGNVN